MATICIDYYDLGYTTGLMACDILLGKADISQMPIAYSPVFHTVVNPVLCELLNIPVPQDCEMLTD